MKREAHFSAGFVVFREAEERHFLLLRSALTRRPLWEFPKGAIEPGETQLQAAQRELREETGLDEGSYALLGGFQDVERYLFTLGSGSDQRLVRKQVVYFLARWREGDVRISREASRYAWVSATDAARLLRFPEKRRVLANAVRFLEDSHGSRDGVSLTPVAAV